MKIPSFHPSRSAVASSTKIMVAFIAVIALFHQDLEIVASEAMQSELASYILFIPFLLAYVLYRRRKMLRAVIQLEAVNIPGELTYINEVAGALLFLTAFLLYWYGSYTFYSLEYHIVSLPLFVSGLILIMFSTQMLRVLAFPVASLFLLTPPPSEIAYIGGASIATLSSEISYNVLTAMGLPVSIATEYGAPTLVATTPSGSSISFVIGEASSGIYSLIGFGIFAAFLVYIARGPLWKKATLFLVSIPLIYALNIIRIIILISIGYWQGINLALDFFHLFGGWALILLGSLILIALSEKIWKTQIFTAKHIAISCTNCNPLSKNDHDFCHTCGKLLKYTPIRISKRDFCKIVALIVFAILITTISVPVFALTEGPAQVLVQAPGNEQATTKQIFPEISGYDLRFVYRDTDFEQRALRDRALVYAYVPTNTSTETIWISLEIGSSRSTWHEWEASIINWRLIHGRSPTAIQLDLRDVQLLQNPPIMGKFFSFQRIASNTTQVVLYWYENSLFDTGSSTTLKYSKISLIAYPENLGDIPQTENMLLQFGKIMAAYWQPIKTWSLLAIALAQNGLLLTAITATTLIIVLALETLKRKSYKKSNLHIIQKFTAKDKLVFKAVQQAKHNKPTPNAIAENYEKLAGEPIEPETLLRKLTEAEEAGLVKKEITSQEDEVLIVWKSQVPLGKGIKV